jgi:hypothetical protein
LSNGQDVGFPSQRWGFDSPRPLFQSQAQTSLSAEDNLKDNPGALEGRAYWRAGLAGVG